VCINYPRQIAIDIDNNFKKLTHIYAVNGNFFKARVLTMLIMLTQINSSLFINLMTNRTATTSLQINPNKYAPMDKTIDVKITKQLLTSQCHPG
jgi:hypothetical protein